MRKIYIISQVIFGIVLIVAIITGIIHHELDVVFWMFIAMAWWGLCLANRSDAEIYRKLFKNSLDIGNEALYLCDQFEEKYKTKIDLVDKFCKELLVKKDEKIKNLIIEVDKLKEFQNQVAAITCKKINCKKCHG